LFLNNGKTDVGCRKYGSIKVGSKKAR